MTHSTFTRLMKDRAGNFGIMTAVMLPVLLGVAGVAIDLTRVMEEKNQLQALADSATLGAASAMADKGTMTEAEAEEMGTSILVGQKMQEYEKAGMDPNTLAATRAELKKNTEADAKITIASNTAANYTVTMTTGYDVPLNGLTAMLGFTKMHINVTSTSQAGREGNALSMYLALDESGSMAWDTTTVDVTNPTKTVMKSVYEENYVCGTKGNGKPKYCTGYHDVATSVPNYVTKMASLKAAAGTMFFELGKADPDKTLIRVGADSYDDKTKAEQPIGWGETDVSTYITNLPAVPDGGTDATGALTNALNALKVANTKEKNAHAVQNNTSFERFIVFMTDGEMTGNSSSWNSSIDAKVRELCLAAKSDGQTDAVKTKLKNGDVLTEEEKSKGIKIYTIAFMAPDKGKSLLNYCSSGAGYYYEPTNMTQLVQSFGEIARKAAKTGTRLTN